MRTFSSLKGLPVYVQNSDEQIGKIADLYLAQNGNVIGLLVEGQSFFKRDRLLPITSILSYSDERITVDDITSLRPVQHIEGAYFLYKHGELAGKTVLTDKGKKLGLLDDVYFQEEVGTIIGYEVTEGFFTDITEGKKLVSTSEDLRVSKEAIVVHVNSNL